MTADRRHTDHPTPPEGLSDRRRCSDSECMSARTEWYESTLLPKLTNMFWKGLFVACSVFLGTFVASLFFIVEAKIDKHTLDATNNLSANYVKLPEHNSAISRIERKIESLETSMTDSMQDVSEKLDRNFAQIQTGGRR